MCYARIETTHLTKNKEDQIVYCCKGTDALMDAPLVGAYGKDIYPTLAHARILDRDVKFRAKGKAPPFREAFNTPSKGWRIFDSTLELGAVGNITVTSHDVTHILDPHNHLASFNQETKCFHLKPHKSQPEVCINKQFFIIINRHLRGWTNQQIANLIHKSVRAVEYHLRHARKLAKKAGPDCTIAEAVQASGLSFMMANSTDWFA